MKFLHNKLKSLCTSRGLFFSYWYSEQRAEQKLQFYITKLEKRFTVEEHSFSDFDVDNSVKEGLYNDFTLEADCEGIDHIYFDRKIHALYFLETGGDRVEAHIFNYKWATVW